MRVAIAVLPALLAACAGGGLVLEPPAGRSDQAAIAGDIRECLDYAKLGRELTPAERTALEGKPTARLFMNERPVVTPQGKPALHRGAFSGSESTPFADSYATCLLAAGYAWGER